jgi:TolB-like protein/tetratricopeptide (TPR) repeat protein
VRLDQPERPALALPDKPSIAVLPFQNMSGDPEQEYFADGMVEEIITGLSRVRSFFVIARNSSFAYKGKSPDVRQVGRELGVRYVLEGSVRKAGHRVRITGQLVDATSGAHLWADRFDSALEDIFELQDRVTASVIGAIEPRLEQAEIERIKRKPTANLDAYDYFLRGSESVYRWTDEAIEEGLRLLYRAIELDPDFAAPYALATFCYCWRTNTGTVINREQEIVETTRLAQRAVQLGKDDAFAFCWAGFSLARVVGKLDDGAAFIDRALALNPNLARAWNLSGWVRIWLGEPDIAIEHLARAMRLSPLDRAFHAMQAATAAAHFHADRYDEASAWAEKALRENPLNADAEYYLAASNALAGRLESAQQTMARLLQISPTQRLSNVGALAASYRRPEDYARWLEGLRRAGMPE